MNCFNCNSKHVDIFDTQTLDNLFVIKYECQECGVNGVIELDVREGSNREY